MPEPVTGTGVLRLVCQQALSDGRRDFRDLRLELPATPEAVTLGRAVTLHENWPLADAEVTACDWDGTRLKATVVVSHPAVDGQAAGARRIEIHVDAERRGRLLRGRWSRADDGRTDDLWGEWRVDPPVRFRRFVSPGLIVGAEDIAAARDRIATGGDWERAWALLRDRADVWRVWQPRPHARPHFIHWSEPGAVRDLKEDCEAAWGNALLDALGHGDGHALAAARILHAWATTFTGIADTGGHLSTSYCWPAMVWAADLLRACGRLDAATDAALCRCLAEVVRPIAVTDLHENNWMTWANHLEACIAVFCQRGDWFDLAVARYRWLLERYTSPSGCTSETGRDLVHAQMGIAPMVATCELAFRQGIDLYSERQHRLRTVVELHGPFAMGRLDDWPLQVPAREVGSVWPMYELPVRHWLGRLGMPMPRSVSVLETHRPEGFSRIGWGTLLHAWEGERARLGAFEGSDRSAGDAGKRHGNGS
jgi:hypothetical protein